ALGQAISPTTWEFKLASFTVNTSANLGSGQTDFKVIQPAATNSGVPTAIYATYASDGSTINVTPDANNTSVYAQPGHFITFSSGNFFLTDGQVVSTPRALHGAPPY